MNKESSLPYGFKRWLGRFGSAVACAAMFMTYLWRKYFLYGGEYYFIFSWTFTALFIGCLLYNLVFLIVKFHGFDTLMAKKEGVVSNVYVTRAALVSGPKIEVQFEDDPMPKRVCGFFEYGDKKIFKLGTKVVCRFYQSGKIALNYAKKEEAKQQSAGSQRQKDTERH
jgi:hypothetical protein